ncbi:MAG: hypothetical protein A3J63_04115 [Candidatus Moranbacteria bacterium RIFCSPHIGHO2_02_FULL_40_12b]|nr:MAG: hypothetical protein A3J63_04115 [Candidatus Moranbacteria bacterium RIFCSPHIGHO2_02_FULL_40_12b]OGI24300.1 MAG: hypothetical protein A3E91_01095 [Candidatus Moranbacteria bacterium RIFCSPHIGHO2_12_FULL_40_10]
MDFIGNKKAVTLLEKTIQSGKVSQAYLFSGPEAVGKFTLAKFFSRAIISNQSFTSILRNIKVNAGKDNFLLDLIVLSPDVEEKNGIIREKDIPIEKIRNAQKELTLYPYQGKYKVLIINDAHKLTEQSQNALLKTLEEPNSTSVIILATHEEAKIFPTIKSRCQKINFNLVPDSEINLEASEMKDISLYSLGRPGLAVNMINKKEELSFFKGALDELRELSSASVNQRLAKAEEISKNKIEAIKKMNVWIWFLHKKSITEPKFFSILEKIHKCMDEINNTNASARLLLENLFLDL